MEEVHYRRVYMMYVYVSLGVCVNNYWCCCKNLILAYVCMAWRSRSNVYILVYMYIFTNFQTNVLNVIGLETVGTWNLACVYTRYAHCAILTAKTGRVGLYHVHVYTTLCMGWLSWYQVMYVDMQAWIPSWAAILLHLQVHVHCIRYSFLKFTFHQLLRMPSLTKWVQCMLEKHQLITSLYPSLSTACTHIF